MFVELIQWKIIAENTQVELKVAGFTSTFIFEPIPVCFLLFHNDSSYSTWVFVERYEQPNRS